MGNGEVNAVIGRNEEVQKVGSCREGEREGGVNKGLGLHAMLAAFFIHYSFHLFPTLSTRCVQSVNSFMRSYPSVLNSKGRWNINVNTRTILYFRTPW